MDGTNTFVGRNKVTDIIESRLNELFSGDEIEIVPFGVLNIINNNNSFKDYFAKMEVNQKPASMIVKFAPDYIILKKTEPQELYFLEIKCSVTPCWATSRINKIKNKHVDLQVDESNVGEIAREALLSYNRFYPNTIVLYGASYNEKILMAQFAHNIQCLYCYKREGEYDCLNCPSKNNGFFEQERNQHSSGSQTANTNIYLDSFMPARDFFGQIGIHLQQEVVDEISRDICERNVSFPKDFDFDKESQIRTTLVERGCDWVQRISRYFWTLNNGFYHAKKDCFTLKGVSEVSVGSEEQAIQLGKKKCKFCG